VGLPLPDTEAMVVDPDTGAPLPPGTAGELIVRGPQLMRGYWNREADTAKALRDGWLWTGDIARMDEDGYFYVIDRKKDVIFMAGYPIYPRDIEEVLYEHAAVHEAAVVGVPDWGETRAIRVFVVAREGVRLTPEQLVAELTAHLAKRLPPHAVPASLQLVKQLPRNMLGKVLRRELAARVARTNPTHDDTP
jgi:long-chain acyl-CoA synthetase